MSQETILYHLDSGVATITLNRPKTLNAFNAQMVKEVTQALKQAARDPEVRCVVLTGAGRGFSSGQDLVEAASLFGQPDSRAGDRLQATYHPLIQHMIGMDKPVIGVINGIAAGIGMSIALATDIRLASDQAIFTLGFSRIGLVPDGGANWLLTRLVGYARAYEIAITAENIPAQQAQQEGLVNHVYPHAALAENANAYARKLAAGPTLAFGLTKRAMLRGLSQTLIENFAYEADLQTLAARSADCREGVMAFLEKRTPEYSGK